MKKISGYLAIVSLLMACSKSDSEKPRDEDPGPVKYLAWFGSKNGNSKTGITITYDAQNRLTAWTSNEQDPTHMRKAYDADGNLVMSEVWTDDVLSRIYIHYVNGKPDTAVERFFLRATNAHLSTSYLKYTLENDRVVRVRMKDSAGQSLESDIYYRYQGNNMTSMLHVGVAQMTDTIHFAEWTYGQKRSPYIGAKMKYHVTVTGPAILFPNANEQLTQYVRMPALNATIKEKFVYQYDRDGFPVRQAGVDEGATDSTIVFYEYRP